MPNNLIFVDGRKFMWDGVDHPSGERMSEAANKYKADGFDVEQHEEDGKTYLYTRRVVTKVNVVNA